ncbi:hypothetical protein PAHAL_9G587500 [Panicum hallii]|uniref:Uncharacterized protein n=1 Tax=Panicum hallii TaxID=206008 RepID=A0A2T8I679_9POAL|nr:hypothetical protein PAHAL_9G587500 [Panicum hallii]
MLSTVAISPNDSPPRFVCSHTTTAPMDMLGRASRSPCRGSPPPPPPQVVAKLNVASREERAHSLARSRSSLRFSTAPSVWGWWTLWMEEVQGAFSADGRLTFPSSLPSLPLDATPAPCLLPRESASSTAADP